MAAVPNDSPSSQNPPLDVLLISSYISQVHVPNTLRSVEDTCIISYLLNMVSKMPEVAVSAELGSACCTESAVEQGKAAERRLQNNECMYTGLLNTFTLMSPWLRLHLTLTDMHLE